jgi:hypothetical protein
MTFYITERYYNIDGRHVRFVHNILTGVKRIYVDGIQTRSTSIDLFERCHVQRMNITGVNRDLLISPTWFGTFIYTVAEKQYGYGLLDEALL